jgi:hypothetical protein
MFQIYTHSLALLVRVPDGQLVRPAFARVEDRRRGEQVALGARHHPGVLQRITVLRGPIQRQRSECGAQASTIRSWAIAVQAR